MSGLTAKEIGECFVDCQSYRDWLIGMALQGKCAADFVHKVDIAREAIDAADAVLAELEKEA